MTARPAQVLAAFGFFEFWPPDCGFEAYLEHSISAWKMKPAMVGH